MIKQRKSDTIIAHTIAYTIRIWNYGSLTAGSHSQTSLEYKLWLLLDIKLNTLFLTMDWANSTMKRHSRLQSWLWFILVYNALMVRGRVSLPFSWFSFVSFRFYKTYHIIMMVFWSPLRLVKVYIILRLVCSNIVCSTLFRPIQQSGVL